MPLDDHPTELMPNLTAEDLSPAGSDGLYDLAQLGGSLNGNSAFGQSIREPLTCEYFRDLTEADLVRLDEPRSQSLGQVVERLNSLSHRHHLAARMVADGMGTSEIAYACNYSPSYISGLKSDPAFREVVSSYASKKEAVYLDVHQRLGSLAMTAVDVMQERLAQPESAAKVSFADLRSVAEMALDRSLAPKKGGGGGFNGSGADIGGGLVVNLNFDAPGKPAHGPTIDVSANVEPSDANS